jgi:hypothetical protein
MRALRHLLLLGIALTLGCPAPDLYPLVGDGPEIAKLLGKPLPAEPANSAMAAARMLHQALVQKDAEMVWALLSSGTRRVLDERGALIGTSGRELLDSSTLPTQGGLEHKVRFETLFFGPDPVELVPPSDDHPPLPPDRDVLFARSGSGAMTELSLVREEDGWKLEKTELSP